MTGAILVHESYDAFGQRRGANWSGTPSGSDWATIKANTQRGYTDHEQLDNLNLIHMNGRVYDPAIGRFQSADPYVPEPYNGQSFNRYSYVNNSPLSYTDPSGFWWVGVDNANLCDGDCYFTMELNFHWSDWVQFADLGDRWSSWREHSSADDTVIPHPERSDEYDDDWRWAKDIGKGIADFVILDSVRGAVEVYEAVRAGDYQAAVIGMAGVGCDVVKACKAVDKLADGAKKVVRAARGGESAAAAAGRRAHGNYGTALGEKYDTRVTLPSGRRPDAVDWEAREVRELKPDNPAAVRRGERQVERYRKELEEVTGEPWTSVVDVYRSSGQ